MCMRETAGQQLTAPRMLTCLATLMVYARWHGAMLHSTTCADYLLGTPALAAGRHVVPCSPPSICGEQEDTPEATTAAVAKVLK
jgi:hypothetical protein